YFFVLVRLFFFFFQAEDGIRDATVTGVQTCALPICFVGSGTTAAVAEKLDRRWVVCDLSRFGIHTTRKRLLSLPGVRPFIVQNRSEERRVGKECRSRWWKAYYKR